MFRLIRLVFIFGVLVLVPLTPVSGTTYDPAAAGCLAPHRGAAAYATSSANARRAGLTLEWALTNNGSQAIYDLEVYVPIPLDRDNQRITGLQFSAPFTPVEDQYGQPVARIRFDQVAAGERVTVSWTGEVEIEARHYGVDPARTGGLDQVPAEIARIYTRDEAQYRLDSALIRRVAQEAAREATNPYWIARNIHDFIAHRLSYDMDGEWDDAETVYRQETGSCSEYTYLFIALARANGLPARYVAGTVLPAEAPYVDTVFHRWAEVYLPGYGWVPVDVVHDDRNTGLIHDYFGAIGDERFVTTVGGGDSDVLGWAYHSGFRYLYQGQRPDLSVERSFRWVPGTPELSANVQDLSRRVSLRGRCVPLGQITLIGINGAADWSAQPGASWLLVDRASGSTPAAVQVLANTSHLTPGTHTADLVFRSRATGAETTVPISVYAAPTYQSTSRTHLTGPR